MSSLLDDKIICVYVLKFQFTGINVSNISFIVLNSACEPGWWIHASLSEFNIDGSVVSSKKSLIFSVILSEVNVSRFDGILLLISFIHQSHQSILDQNVEAQQREEHPAVSRRVESQLDS